MSSSQGQGQSPSSSAASLHDQFNYYRPRKHWSHTSSFQFIVLYIGKFTQHYPRLLCPSSELVHSFEIAIYIFSDMQKYTKDVGINIPGNPDHKTEMAPCRPVGMARVLYFLSSFTLSFIAACTDLESGSVPSSIKKLHLNRDKS